MSLFLQGLAIGLAYVAPIGMQNLFVINAALTQPRRRLIPITLIVIFFDVSLMLACFFGIGALVERFAWLQMTVLAVGGLVVCWIGAGLIRERPSMDRSVDMDIPLAKIAAKAFVVTWINPQALIDGTMMLGAFRVTLPGAQSLPFICGVTSASCLWFTGVTLLISVFSSKFNSRVMRWINVVCGAVILFYGGKLFWSFVQMLLH